MGLKDITGWGQAGNLIEDADVADNADIERAKLGTRTVYLNIPLSAMTLTGAGAVKTNQGVYAGVVMPDANSTTLYFTFMMPDDYDSGNIVFTILWNTAATSGDIEFILAIGGRASGEALSSDETDTFVDTAAGTTTVLNKVSTTISNVPSPGELVGISLQRIPAAGNDTLSADANILLIRMEYTARG